jgi:cytochrome b561
MMATHLRNGEHGYGVVTKLLHWLTVIAIVAQFVVGWTMAAGDDGARERFEQRLDRLEEQAEAQGEAAEERWDAEEERLEEARPDSDDDGPSTLHVVLGLSIMGLALVRLLWRRTTPLPPWAEYLSPRERQVESWLEKLLLTMLLVTPGTGLLLVAGEDDWLPVHVTAQIALLALIAVHVGLVLKHTVVRRDRHLARML